MDDRCFLIGWGTKRLLSTGERTRDGEVESESFYRIVVSSTHCFHEGSLATQYELIYLAFSSCRMFIT